MKDAIKTAKEQFKHCSWWGGGGEALPARHVARLFSEINRLRNEVKLLNLKLGINEITLEHKTNLLGFRDKELANRDEESQL
jgi:hypothetical protein